MCAKFGCGPTVVSKKGGYRQTDRQRDAAALYSRRKSRRPKNQRKTKETLGEGCGGQDGDKCLESG